MADNDVKKLSKNQVKALDALLQCRTVAQAATLAGLSARTIWRYLADDTFKAELKRRQDETLSATTAALSGLSQRAIEALTQALNVLTNQAGASAGDFIAVDDGKWSLDLEGAEDNDLLHLVKRLWTDRNGNERLELHDAQAAADRLGRLALAILDERRKSVELDELSERVRALEESLKS